MYLTPFALLLTHHHIFWHLRLKKTAQMIAPPYNYYKFINSAETRPRRLFRFFSNPTNPASDAHFSIFWFDYASKPIQLSIRCATKSWLKFAELVDGLIDKTTASSAGRRPGRRPAARRPSSLLDNDELSTPRRRRPPAG